MWSFIQWYFEGIHHYGWSVVICGLINIFTCIYRISDTTKDDNIESFAILAAIPLLNYCISVAMLLSIFLPAISHLYKYIFKLEIKK